MRLHLRPVIGLNHFLYQYWRKHSRTSICFSETFGNWQKTQISLQKKNSSASPAGSQTLPPSLTSQNVWIGPSHQGKGLGKVVNNLYLRTCTDSIPPFTQKYVVYWWLEAFQHRFMRRCWGWVCWLVRGVLGWLLWRGKGLDIRGLVGRVVGIVDLDWCLVFWWMENLWGFCVRLRDMSETRWCLYKLEKDTADSICWPSKMYCAL